jgi:L-lactate dehydrogenase complex protein LldG
MNSREKILKVLAENQLSGSVLADSFIRHAVEGDPVKKFIAVLKNIGGTPVEVNSWEEITRYVQTNWGVNKRIVSPIHVLATISDQTKFSHDPHALQDVDLAIFQPHFGVAENAAAWLTDERMGDRALPFIAQHIAFVIHRTDIIHTMHEAYDRIGTSSYNFGTFIAGPSKTADIEQSLVLGAHGPKSMTVFLLS